MKVVSRKKSTLQKFLYLEAYALAGFMDFGVGVLVAYVFAHVWMIEVTWGVLTLGGFLALLPDLDIVPGILLNTLFPNRRHINISSHHLWVSHRPLVMLPASFTLGALLAGSFGGILALICVSYHFLHDSLFGGDLNLYWPFGHDAKPLMSGEEWIERYWMQPSVRSLLETLLGVICLIPVLWLSGLTQLSMLALVGLALVLISLWIVPRLVK